MSSGPQFEQAAMEAARLAGALLESRFRAADGLTIEQKGLHDFVTEVDRAAENEITTYLSQKFPDHALMAEEGSPQKTREGHRWIIDPLDGTTNFIHGIPTFCVSIALEDQQGLVAGAIFDPVHKEMFHASRGNGARLNGETIRCSSPAGLEEALLCTGFPFRYFEKLDAYLEVFRQLMQSTSGIRRAGSAALDLAFTACGRYDGFWETGLAPWDLAAGALLVQEAGGIVTDFCGGGDYLLEGEIVAAGSFIHHAMLKPVQKALSK